MRLAAYAPLLAGAAALLMLLASCGSPGPSVTITPSSANIRAGTSIDLQGHATGSGLCCSGWYVQESYNLDPSKSCGYADANEISTSDCPFGYVLYDVHQLQSKGTYTAPSTPGTYHVTFYAIWFSGNIFGEGSKDATATITVTP